MCLIAANLLSSCASNYETIGKVSMLAPDRVDRGIQYKPLAANTGSSKKEITASKAQSVTQAVQQVIDKVPGGKYMTNVTVYVVNGGYLAVKGDVWGVGTDSVPALGQNDKGYFTMKLLDRQKNINTSNSLAIH